MLQLLGTVLETFQAANSQSGLDKDMEVSASRLMPWKNHYCHAQKLHFTDCTFSPPPQSIWVLDSLKVHTALVALEKWESVWLLLFDSILQSNVVAAWMDDC